MLTVKYRLNQSFNTQPPEGGWNDCKARHKALSVSTRSRPKAAGHDFLFVLRLQHVSTRSRPKAAGNHGDNAVLFIGVSTRSRPKAAGQQASRSSKKSNPFQHAAARRRLVEKFVGVNLTGLFQHAAARRRLEAIDSGSYPDIVIVSTRSRPKAAGIFKIPRFRRAGVSTRSRPKAAGNILDPSQMSVNRFNTQPPEGGWVRCEVQIDSFLRFQHAAARRRLGHCAMRRAIF